MTIKDSLTDLYISIPRKIRSYTDPLVKNRDRLLPENRVEKGRKTVHTWWRKTIGRRLKL